MSRLSFGSANRLACLAGTMVIVGLTCPVIAWPQGQRDEESTPAGEAGDVAGDDNPLSAGVDVDVLSQYAFRGFVITEGPVMQPYAYVTYEGITLDVYANMNLDRRDVNRGRFDELFFDVYWTRDIGELSVEPGFTYYHYPLEEDGEGYPDTGEVFLALSRPLGPLRVGLLNTLDVVEYPRSYYGSLWVEYQMDLTHRIAFDSSVEVDFATDPGEDDDEYSSLAPEFGLSFTLGNVSVRPHVSFGHFLHAAFVPEHDNVWISGVTVGVQF